MMVYISSCTQDGGIHCFNITEQFTIENSNFYPLNMPMYATAKDKTMYVVLRKPFKENDYSGVVTLNIKDNGELSNNLEIVSTEGIVGCHICVDDGQAYVTNYISGSVCKIYDKVVTHNGSSINLPRQESAHTHFITVTPDEKYLMVTDLGMDKIFVYDKQLTEIYKVNTPLGAGPRHLAFSADGKYCYCANELDSSVSVYGYKDGNLLLKNTYTTLPIDFDGTNLVSAIRCYNGYVYVSNRGHNSIACYKAEGDTLELKAINYCFGDSPRDFDMRDNLLICANENDNSVTVFEVKNKYEFEFKQKINIPKALCVTFVDI